MTVEGAFHHIGIAVRDLDRTLEFWHDVFGLDPKVALQTTLPADGKESSRRKRVAFLSFGNALMELREVPRGEPTEVDLDRDAVGYAYPGFTVGDLRAVREELLAKGYELTEPIVVGGDSPIAGTLICFIRDPDGKDVELLQVADGLAVDTVSDAPAMSLADSYPYVVTNL